MRRSLCARWIAALMLTGAAISRGGSTHPMVVRDETANFSFELPAGSRVERPPDMHTYWVWPSTGGYLRLDVEDWARIDPGHFVNALGPGHLVWVTGMASLVQTRNRHGIAVTEYRAHVQETTSRCSRGRDTVVAQARCDSGWVACEPSQREWTAGPFWVATVLVNGGVATVDVGWERHAPAQDSVCVAAGRALVSTIRAIRK